MARLNDRNVTHYWCDRHIRGLSLMRADFRSHDYARHMHDAFVIVVTELGGSRVYSRGVVDEIKSSLLFVSNPMETQSSCMSGIPRWRYRSYYLDVAGIMEISKSLGIPTVPYFTQNYYRDADLIERFRSLHQSFERGGDALREREEFIETFGSLFRRYGSGGMRLEAVPRDRTILRRMMEMIQERYAERLHLEDLAIVSGLNQFQLIGLFKRIAGITPHAYVTQVRLDAARRMLRSGCGIAQAAAAAGFYDQSALTRHFKRCYGMTPSQFARSG
jgi:AraC-like DNA-binding protein